MKNILFIALIFVTGNLFSDDHRKMPGEMKEKMMMVKLKMDLAELKGPPSLNDLEKKRANRIADLDLLINSGKYEGTVLERLTNMRARVVESTLPSQEVINQRHDRRLRMMKAKMKSRVRIKEKRFRDQRRDREMLERERWEMRKQRNKNRNRNRD